jgi:hypothetical protein
MEVLTLLCVHKNWVLKKQNEQGIETVDISWSLAEYTIYDYKKNE